MTTERCTITDAQMEELYIIDDCPRCGADLVKVATCGICKKNIKRTRAYPEHHKYDLWLTLSSTTEEK